MRYWDRNIVTDILRLKVKSEETSIEELEKLKFKETLESMIKRAWTFGIGLAAVQMGIPLRAGLYWYPNRDTESILLLNPKIVDYKEPVCILNEGCLSLPNRVFHVLRYRKIKYINNGKEYEASGKLAQLIQHEVDHMDGLLAIDRALDIDRKLERNQPCPCNSGKKWKKCCYMLTGEYL